MRPVKRIVLWVLSTLSAVVVLFGYHTSTSSVMATTSDSAISGSLQAQSTSGSSSSGTGGSTPANGSAAGSSSGTVTGTAAQTRYGPVQVQLDVSGSKVTNVTVLQYPDADGRDLQISRYALPKLIQQTLDDQGGSVSMVSGATYTSQGYAQSLQSALDQAGL